MPKMNRPLCDLFLQEADLPCIAAIAENILWLQIVIKVVDANTVAIFLCNYINCYREENYIFTGVISA